MLVKLKQGAYDNISVIAKHFTYITIPWDYFNGSCLILIPPAHMYLIQVNSRSISRTFLGLQGLRMMMFSESEPFW